MTGLSPPTADEMISIASSTKDIMDPTIDPLSAASTRPAISKYVPPNPEDGSGIHRYGTRIENLKYVLLNFALRSVLAVPRASGWDSEFSAR